MKEILVLAACLGIMLIVLRVVVSWLERVKGRLARKREEGEVGKKEEGSDGLVPVIVAGITAYEEVFGAEKRERKSSEV